MIFVMRSDLSIENVTIPPAFVRLVHLWFLGVDLFVLTINYIFLLLPPSHHI